MTEQERDIQRADACQIEVLRYLNHRTAVAAQTAEVIARTMRAHSFDYTAEEVKAACLFWEGMNDVERCYMPGGSIPHFKITSQGILTYRRSQV